MNARQACALLATGVLSYELYCKDGELLNECVDEWLASRVIRHGYGTTGLPGGRDHLFGSVGIIWGCWAGCQLWVFGGACRTGLR